MKTYHPLSWSQQARHMADVQFNWWRYYNENPDKVYMYCKEDSDGNRYQISSADIRHYLNFFSSSYRNPIITKRAAKRFGRLIKKYKHWGVA